MTDVTARGDEGEFRIGHVISSAWKVLTDNFLFSFLVAVLTPGASFLIFLIFLYPMMLAPISDGGYFDVSMRFVMRFASPYMFFKLLTTIPFVGYLALSTIGQAIIVAGAFQYLRGQSVRPGEAFRQALTRFLPLLGLAVLYSLGVSLGFLLWIVPGWILLTLWAIAVPACVVERAGPIASMGRSIRLTKGHRWKTLGAMLSVYIVRYIAIRILALMLMSAGIYAVGAGIVLLLGFVDAFLACMIAIIYHDLRIAKEGIASREITAELG